MAPAALAAGDAGSEILRLIHRKETYMTAPRLKEKYTKEIVPQLEKDLGITNRSRVLMVGDDLLADIKGGINAGIDTCWVNFANEENKTGIQPKYTVHSYEELYRVVMEPEELENVGVRNRRHMNEG